MKSDSCNSNIALFVAVVIASVVWKRRHESSDQEHSSSCSPPPEDVVRFRRLVASGRLVHPFLRAHVFEHHKDCCSLAGKKQDEDCVANFTDLATALALCCGVNDLRNDCSHSHHCHHLANDIGGIERRHIIVILCDGMGNSVLKQHLNSSSSSSSTTAFLCRNNQWDRLRAVFPSTTPAALTTLATAAWPGQHGIPGWDLREQPSCEFPGTRQSMVQLRILAPRIMNVRTDEPAAADTTNNNNNSNNKYYSSLDDNVFVIPPWSRSLSKLSVTETRRRVMYINAYNGDDFPSWYQGKTKRETKSSSHASDFSSWQTGQTQQATMSEADSLSLLNVATIGETSFSTLGEPEGSQAALEYFRDGIRKALQFIAQAEANGGESTFTYLYTAHPDKHMHALGTSHAQVSTLVRGINAEIEQMWNLMGNRTKLLESFGIKTASSNSASHKTVAPHHRIDAAMVVTADHGHISVFPEDMIVLPDNIVECLEYANIGVHGKGRHGYLHCRAGLQATLRKRWRACPKLSDSFLLLTIEEASDHGLFGPQAPTLKVRPRLGDFVAIAVSERTLVTRNEWNLHNGHCQGAHGSLLEAEMNIPFILCTPSHN